MENNEMLETIFDGMSMDDLRVGANPTEEQIAFQEKIAAQNERDRKAAAREKEQEIKQLDAFAKQFEKQESKASKERVTKGTPVNAKEKSATDIRNEKIVLIRKIRNYKQVFATILKGATLGPMPTMSTSLDEIKAYYADIKTHMGKEGALDQARFYCLALCKGVESFFTDIYRIDGIYLRGFTEEIFTPDAQGRAPIDCCDVELNELVIDKEEWFTTNYVTRALLKIGNMAKTYSDMKLNEGAVEGEPFEDIQKKFPKV